MHPFLLLVIFVTYTTRSGKILLAWASWPNSNTSRRVLGESLLQHISLLLFKGYISHSRCYFGNPNGENMQTWVVSLQYKLERNPTVNKYEIVVLPKQILGQSWNHTVIIVMQINQTPHNLTSTPSSGTRIIHTKLQIIQINQVIK